MDIVKDSDIKIKITSIKDSEGTEIAPANIYLLFKLTDKFSHSYECIWTKTASTSTNVKLGDDGKLYLILENYELKGQLYLQIATQTTDAMFSDSNWKWLGKEKKIDVVII